MSSEKKSDTVENDSKMEQVDTPGDSVENADANLDDLNTDGDIETTEVDEKASEDSEAEEEIEEIDPIELFDLAAAKDHIYKLRTQLTSATEDRDTAREKVNELGSRLKSLSEAYQKKGDEVTKAKARLERQSKFKEDRRRGEVVSSLFEPYENLKRSIDAIEKAGVEASHIEGLRIVSTSFMGAFNTLGLEEVPGVGAPFDPNIHEALMVHEVDDPTLKDAVIQVFAAGYRIGDLVLRPAKVIVGSYSAPVEIKASEEVEDAEVVEQTDIESGDDE